MKNKYLILTIGILAIGLSVSAVSETNAQITGEICPQGVIDEIQDVKIQFYNSLEAQLESADLTSERLHDVYEDFRNTEERIRGLTRRRPDLQPGDISTSIGAVEQCQEVIQSQLDEIRTVFTTFASEVSSRTRNYLLIEKYDQINDKLQLLQEELHDTRQDINTFHDQLPCFTDRCIRI